MDTQLATAEVQGWTAEQTNLIRSMFGKDLSNDELQLFLYTAKRIGLDPLARQIYAVKRGGRMTIQTGIDGYRLIADRTGKLAGISDYDFAHEADGQKFPSTASVTVKKLITESMVADFTATARWGEYNAGGPMWQKMPYLMLGKCAEALALRKAFPADLSGVYTAEEMAQADSEPERKAVEAEVVRQKQEPAALPPELEWSPLTKSGVLICRAVDVKLRQKKAPAKGEFVAVKVNGQVKGKDVLFYFHESHRDALLNAIGKVCKFEVDDSGDFPNIERVLEIDGQTIAKSEPEGDPEVKARLLASTLNFSEGELKQMVVRECGWANVLRVLQEIEAGKDAEVEEVAQ